MPALKTGRWGPRPVSAADNRRAVDRWNSAHPVGTAVILTMDGGEERETKTRTVAQMLTGHTPVVWVDGLAGCWALDRVRPMP